MNRDSKKPTLRAYQQAAVDHIMSLSEPARPKSAVRLWIELLLIAAGCALLIGGSICMIIDSVVEVQQAQAFKG